MKLFECKSALLFPLMNIIASTVNILRHLVGFDTTSRDSNLPLIEWVEAYLRGHGVAFERISNPENTKAALMATITANGARRRGEAVGFGAVAPTEKDGIVLSGHTDVVPVDGQNWHTPPFELTEKDGRLYGRGTADMKGFIACCLAMVPQWVARPLPFPLHLALSFDEEIGCRAAGRIGEFIAAQGWKPRLVIVGEPTLMQPVTAHKGIYSFVTTVSGKEAHSSQTQSGVNAIEYAALLIGKIQALAAQAKTTQDARFTPPYSTLQVGVIQGGTARNIVPQQCRFEWEIRPIPQDDPPAALDDFFAFEKQLHAEMQQQDASCGIETRPASRVTSLKPEADETLQQLMLHLSESNSLHAVAYGTEAGILQSHGLPCFICGPGDIAQAHIPNEYVEISQLERCLRLLGRLQG
jgi:acetylornithine deacetylase